MALVKHFFSLIKSFYDEKKTLFLKVFKKILLGNLYN